MTELVSLVNTAEAVSAAVQNGADAVCAALALPGRAGLSREEFYGASVFCRVRGVKLYAEVDITPTDSVFDTVLSAARAAWLNGAAAIRASGPALMLALRRSMPEAQIQAGSLMNVHISDSVRIAAAMGAKRAALAPQLSKEQILEIAKGAEIELELPIHGWLSPSCPGLFLLPALYGAGSERRGGSYRESLSHYKLGVKGSEPLVLPDLCLLSHVGELSELGVSAVSVDGRERRPEYVAAVTQLYSRALSGVKLEIEDELRALYEVCPTAGYTDGYYTGRGPADRTVVSAKPAEDGSTVISELRKSYMRREFQRVPVHFTAELALGKPIKLTAVDDLGNEAASEGGKCDLAFHRELTSTRLQTELYKTGGTPFLTASVKASIQKGVSADPKDISGLMDSVLEELMEKRTRLPERTAAKAPPLPDPAEPSQLPPVLTVSVLRASQLTERLLELAPPVVYVPITELASSQDSVLPFIRAEGITVAVTLPPFFTDADKPKLTSMLMSARQLGVEDALCENLGHALFLKNMGFRLRGGVGLGVLSSGDTEVLKKMNFKSAVLSPELSAAEVADLKKYLPTELTVYGRLPVAHCVFPLSSGLSGEGYAGIPDRDGIVMPSVRSASGRETLYSAKKLFLARRSRDYMNCGLWGVRLDFTTENPEEVSLVTERYLGEGRYEPASFTRGLF